MYKQKLTKCTSFHDKLSQEKQHLKEFSHKTYHGRQEDVSLLLHEGRPSYSKQKSVKMVRKMQRRQRRRYWICCGGGGGTALSESCNKMNNEQTSGFYCCPTVATSTRPHSISVSALATLTHFPPTRKILFSCERKLKTSFYKKLSKIQKLYITENKSIYNQFLSGIKTVNNYRILESAGNSSCCYNASFVSPLWSVAASSVHSWEAGRGGRLVAGGL